VRSASLCAYGLVESAAVYGRDACQRSRKGLIGDAHDVAQRLLGEDRRSRGLRADAELGRSATFRHAVPRRQQPGPELAGGAQLGDLLEQVAVQRAVKCHPRGQVVRASATLKRPVEVGEGEPESERQFLRRADAVLAQVVHVDVVGVPERQVLAAVGHQLRGRPQAQVNRARCLVAAVAGVQRIVLDRAPDLAELGRDQ
jgi:hypothetical protein